MWNVLRVKALITISCLSAPVTLAETISVSIGNVPPIAAKAIVLVDGGSIPKLQPILATTTTGGSAEISLNLGVPAGGPYRVRAIAVMATGAILRSGQIASTSLPANGSVRTTMILQDVTAVFESATPSSAAAGSTVPIQLLITDPGDALAQPSTPGLHASFTPFTANDSGGAWGNNTTTPLGAQQYRISITSTLPPNGGTWYYQVSTQAMQFVVPGLIPTFYYPNVEVGQALKTLTISGPPADIPSVVLNSSVGHVASGGGWKTTLAIINLFPAQNSIRVTFRGDDGQPMTVPLSLDHQAILQPMTSVERTLEPGATLFIESEAPVSSTTLIGWAEVRSSGPVSGFAIFRQRGADGKDTEGTAPLVTSKSVGLVVPFDNMLAFATGVALVNSTTETVRANAVIRDDNGNQIGVDTVTLPGFGHTSFIVRDRFPMTSNRRGIVEIQNSSGAVTGLALRFSPFGSFTSLPIITR